MEAEPDGSVQQRAKPLVLLVLAALATPQACRRDSPSPTDPEGAAKRAGTAALTTAAAALQPMPPLRKFDLYMVGFHPMKDDPTHVMEAHHYCAQVNEELAQCVLYDGNTADANLTGIEYIVSERLFESLPAEERKLWHPHNHEILSGELVAPGVPGPAEKAMLARKMNSYGKTWHVWSTGLRGKPGDALPLGPPRLAWSFNADGELPLELLAARDRRMGIDTGEKRRERSDLTGAARPQEGVDELAAAFPVRKKLPGVTETGVPRSEGAPGQTRGGK